MTKKKSKIKKTLVEQILDKENIPYEGMILNALDDSKRPDGVYKTLALIGDKTGPVIGVLPITEHLSYKKFAKVTGNKKVAMIPQKDLQKTTGYVHGANNPVGIWQRHKFPIYFESTALLADDFIVSAGELGRSIKINPKDLANFVEASFADFKE